MIRKLLPVLTVLCLSACATHTARDASPASDLQALSANAERDLAPRFLPNGLLYCLELAPTEGAQDACAGDLEDTLYASEADKARALVALRVGLLRLELARLPTCRWWQLRCQAARRAQQRRIETAAEALPGRGPVP